MIAQTPSSSEENVNGGKSGDTSLSRILVAGLGSIGRRHLRVVRETFPRAEIYVLRHQAGDKPPEANGVFAALEDAIEFSPEAAVIANPAPFHLETAAALAAINCHLLIEKPLTDNADAARELAQRIDDTGVVCQVGYNLRYLPTLREFRRLLKERSAGRALTVRCEVGQYLPEWRPDVDYRQSVSAQAALGGGVLLELSHEIDFLRWIFGEIEWVSAWIGRQSDLDIDVEDSAQLVLGFSPCDTMNAPVASVGMDFFRRDATRRCNVACSDGGLRWCGIRGTVEVFDLLTGSWRVVFETDMTQDQNLREQWFSFLRSIGQEHAPEVGLRDGVAVVEIVDAARRSSQMGGMRQRVGGLRPVS